MGLGFGLVVLEGFAQLEDFVGVEEAFDVGWVFADVVVIILRLIIMLQILRIAIEHKPKIRPLLHRKITQLQLLIVKMQNPEDFHSLLIKVIQWRLDVCEVARDDVFLRGRVLVDRFWRVLLLMS